MRRRITFLTTAAVLLAATGASAEGVIAGQAAEIRKIERKIVGSSQYITVSDGRTFKANQRQTSVLVASQLIVPEAVVAMPEAETVRGRSLGTPIIAYPVARGVDAVPVVVIERSRGLDAGMTSNVFPADVAALGTIQPGAPVAIVGGEPVVIEDGYYTRGTTADTPMLRPLRLTNGQLITIDDRVQRPMPVDAVVAFDPKALEPGAYVRVVQREDGSFFLGTAAAPRETYPGVPAGKVARVDSRAQVVELSDGSLVHPVHRESTVLKISDRAIEPSAIKSGQWLVIDPSPKMTVEAPSAIPADTVAAGRVLRILPR